MNIKKITDSEIKWTNVWLTQLCESEDDLKSFQPLTLHNENVHYWEKLKLYSE